MEEIKYKDIPLVPAENILKTHRDLIPIQERLKVLENPLLDKTVVLERKESQCLHDPVRALAVRNLCSAWRSNRKMTLQYPIEAKLQIQNKSDYL